MAGAKYSFICLGHGNITSRHKTTLEFIKDKDLSLNGDCIVGVKADFSLNKIRRFIKSLGSNNKIAITIEAISNKKIFEIINAEINKNFDSDEEMVIRKTDFVSERTFAVKADKAACDINRELLGFLKGKENKIEVFVCIAAELNRRH